MSEIEFRGKDRTGAMYHDWFYGSLDITTDSDFPKIICKDRFGNTMFIDVDKETIGQYTGFKDQNGKKIFDGDIFEIEENEAIGVVVFEKGAYRIEIYGYREVLYEYGYDTGSWDYLTTEDFDMYYIDQMEVIGNIYDNPELLKGE